MQINEIERKFLVKKLPKAYKKYPSRLVIQGYIVATDDGSEVRIRKERGKLYLTIKIGGDLKRTERTIQLTKRQFMSLWPLTLGRRIKKVRYEIKLGENIAELDIYSDKLKGLKIVEVEFNSVREARKFKLPKWFGKEVTYDKRYKNRNLAIYGLP